MFVDWIEGAPYTGVRKAELIEMHEALHGGFPSRKQASHIDSFIKRESYDEFKEARWINSRHDAFKAWSGPWFSAIEREVYALPQFIKHTPVVDRPYKVHQLVRSGYFYYENDYKSYEAHITPQVMQAVELVLYRYMMQCNPQAAEYMCSVLRGRNRLHTRAGVSMSVEGRRMSGDMCTSLGNGFTNLMLFLYLMHVKGGQGDGYVEGDDGLFATTVPLVAQDFRNLGFEVEIRALVSPTDGHFCGMNMASDGTLFKDPRSLFRKFYWTHSYIHAGPRIMASLYRSKALSLACEVPGCPIAWAMAERALTRTHGCQVTHRESDGYHAAPTETDVRTRRPTTQARLDYQVRYGVTVECQLLVEDAIMAGDFQRVTDLVPPTRADVTYSETFVETD